MCYIDIYLDSFFLPAECSEESFGLSCHFECRCVSGCDPWTGECLGSDKRCFSGFSGSSCQKQGKFGP